MRNQQSRVTTRELAHGLSGPGDIKAARPTRSIRAAAIAVAIVAAAAFATLGSTVASADVIFNNTPTTQPGATASVGYECCQRAEFGGLVKFAGTARKSPKVTVVMTSWACEEGSATENTCKTNAGATFPQKLTLKIYNKGTPTSEGSPPGALITTVTETFQIPYQPSWGGEAHCPVVEGAGWYDEAEKLCFYGFNHAVTFNVPGGVELPEEAVISVAYNTADYGESPTHNESEPANSLNVALTEPAEGLYKGSLWDTKFVGSNPLPADIYQTSTLAEEFCYSADANFGTFSLSGSEEGEGCDWDEYQPMFEVTAVGAPTARTEAVYPITPTSATLHGSVNPHGLNVSDWYVEYGAAPGYGKSVPCPGQTGATEVPVGCTAPVTGLAGSTEYDYRIVATDALSTSYGQNETFKTPPANAPAVTSVSPASGPESGGTTVTIRGVGLAGATAVKFGSATASVTADSATSITATSPAGTGTVNVTVTTSEGTSATNPADEFTYLPPRPKAPTVTKLSPKKGPEAGGTSVTIKGSTFVAGAVVKFGSATASGVKIDSESEITAVSPAGSKGTVNVTVTTAGGTSAISNKDRFKYTKK